MLETQVQNPGRETGKKTRAIRWGAMPPCLAGLKPMVAGLPAESQSVCQPQENVSPFFSSHANLPIL